MQAELEKLVAKAMAELPLPKEEAKEEDHENEDDKEGTPEAPEDEEEEEEEEKGGGQKGKWSGKKGKGSGKKGKGHGQKRKQNYKRPAKRKYKERIEGMKWSDMMAQTKECWVGGVGLRDAVMVSIDAVMVSRNFDRCHDGV